MKRHHEQRPGNGHPGYHNINSDGGASTDNGNGGTTGHRDSSALHSFQQHFRRPNAACSNDFLLDLLHCAPQHQQQQATASALYHHQGYQLLSAPSSSHPAQCHSAYNHYGLPALAAAVAAGGQQMSLASEPSHNSFGTSSGSFNFQNILSRGTVLNYGAPSSESLASTSVNERGISASAAAFSHGCANSAYLKGQRINKVENDEISNCRISVDDIANVLHCALKKEASGLAMKKLKTEPASSDELEDGDEYAATSELSPKTQSTSAAAGRSPRRSSGNGGRGARGSGAHGCPYCPKKFPDTQEAESHQEACVRQRPFDCTHCGRRFRQKTSLVQHLRIHTDNRPYQCRFCVRNFKQKSHLDQHERIHTGAKPYLCKFCNKTFRQKSGQASHELTHTNAMVQQFQTKDDDVDGQQLEETSDNDESDENDEEDESEGGNNTIHGNYSRGAEEEANRRRRHQSSSLSADDIYGRNLPATARN